MTYLEAVYYGEENRSGIRYSNTNKHTERNTDRQIKICPQCDTVYEIYSQQGRKYDQYNYIDFPRYGKGKEKCAECRQKNNEKTFFTWDRGHRSAISMKKFRSPYKKNDRRVSKKEKICH